MLTLMLPAPRNTILGPKYASSLHGTPQEGKRGMGALLTVPAWLTVGHAHPGLAKQGGIYFSILLSDSYVKVEAEDAEQKRRRLFSMEAIWNGIQFLLGYQGIKHA